jgi:hypothetical protein
LGHFAALMQGLRDPMSLAIDNMIWNITGEKITERMIVSPDQVWSVSGPNKPPKPPTRGSVSDPISDFIKAGRWQPAEEAQAPMVKEFKKKYGLQ